MGEEWWVGVEADQELTRQYNSPKMTSNYQEPGQRKEKYFQIITRNRPNPVIIQIHCAIFLT